jgi:hypothetical protein
VRPGDHPLPGSLHESVQAIDQLCHSGRSESKDERLREPAHPDRLDIVASDGADFEKNANQIDCLHLVLIRRSTVRLTRLETIRVDIAENSQDTSEGLSVGGCPGSHAPMMPGAASTGDRWSIETGLTYLPTIINSDDRA